MNKGHSMISRLSVHYHSIPSIQILAIACIALSSIQAAEQPNTYIAFISGFNQPTTIAITPNGQYAYISDTGSNSILVINTDRTSPSWNSIINTPNLIGSFNQPSGIAITPDGSRAYSTNLGDNSVRVIDIATQTVSTPPGLSGVFNLPTAIAIAPNGLYAYVNDYNGSSIRVIDIDPTHTLTYNTILPTPMLNGILTNPFGIAITSNSQYGYISNLNGTMTVIDTNPDSPTFNQPIAAPGLSAVTDQPEGLAITIDNRAAYVTNGAGTDVVMINIDPTSAAFNTVLPAPNLVGAFNYPNGIAIAGKTPYAYVTNFLGNSGTISNITVIDIDPNSPTYNSTLNTPELIIPSITRFLSLAATPDGRYIYAVDGFNNTVAVVATGILMPPQNVSSCRKTNTFLLQRDYSNYIHWSAPATGTPPAGYRIYRDAAMQYPITTVLASAPLEYYDHNRSPYSIDTYYIVSIDAFGNYSAAATTQATMPCP